jgi:hypothetical protein
MFRLSKTADIWTLSYEVSPIRNAMSIAAGVAGLGVGAFQACIGSRSSANWISIVLPSIFCVGVIAYWTMSDAATVVVFDLVGKQIRVESKRPCFGPARSFEFSEVAAIRAVIRSGDSSDSWEARIELRAGETIRLGRQVEGRDHRIRKYLDEICQATGIKT